ncbi:hypothetical protein DPMN_177345 [Dreissena polymorpha]|uniref:Uncharacterized protein n=1 Tax=Dreissena polymorpha TaxID=45954 RepID=A0A9D4ECV8_DREPO|nr:hypothetical protein DPMN_177345 [Dreissena polymorpha]
MINTRLSHGDRPTSDSLYVYHDELCPASFSHRAEALRPSGGRRPMYMSLGNALIFADTRTINPRQNDPVSVRSSAGRQPDERKTRDPSEKVIIANERAAGVYRLSLHYIAIATENCFSCLPRLRPSYTYQELVRTTAITKTNDLKTTGLGIGIQQIKAVLQQRWEKNALFNREKSAGKQVKWAGAKLLSRENGSSQFKEVTH